MSATERAEMRGHERSAHRIEDEEDRAREANVQPMRARPAALRRVALHDAAAAAVVVVAQQHGEHVGEDRHVQQRHARERTAPRETQAWRAGGGGDACRDALKPEVVVSVLCWLQLRG